MKYVLKALDEKLAEKEDILNMYRNETDKLRNTLQEAKEKIKELEKEIAALTNGNITEENKESEDNF